MSPKEALRCAWEVRAGIVPGVALPEFGKRWFVTSDVFYREGEMSDEEFKKEHPDGKSTFVKYRDEAYEYAKSLHDPRSLNWVEVVWIYY